MVVVLLALTYNECCHVNRYLVDKIKTAYEDGNLEAPAEILELHTELRRLSWEQRLQYVCRALFSERVFYTCFSEPKVSLNMCSRIPTFYRFCEEFESNTARIRYGKDGIVPHRERYVDALQKLGVM